MAQKTKRYERGYRPGLTKDAIRQLRTRFFEASPVKAVIFTLFYLFSTYFCAYTFYVLLTSDVRAVLALPAGMGLALLITRQQRALENVVHFGSHLNFSRHHRANDILVNGLAAWPMLSDVKTYRTFHQAHHGHYGGHGDPCRERFERMGVSEIDLSTTWSLSLAVLRWLPGYVREYYRDVGSKARQVAAFVAWHGAATLVLGSVFSLTTGLALTVIWLSVMFVVLPVVRSIAEVGEHDYDRGDTEFDTTYSNLGFWDHALLHPAGDAWHVLHHLYPTIPWWRQRQAHAFLMQHDLQYRNALHRTSMVQPSRPDSVAEPEPQE